MKKWIFLPLLALLTGCISATGSRKTTTEEWDDCIPERREIAPKGAVAVPTIHDGQSAERMPPPTLGGKYKGKRTTTETKGSYLDTRPTGEALAGMAGWFAPDGAGGLILQALGTGGQLGLGGGVGGLALLIGKLWRDSAARKVQLKSLAEKHAAEGAAWDEAQRVTLLRQAEPVKP